MPNQSLFGYITARFSGQQENLATESLHYILRQHSARNAFLQFIGQLAPGLNPVTRLETQTGTDKSARPDMLGRDIDGKPVLAIEAKFWAGLTDRQPIDYIEKVLPKDRRALLLFIAPERRFETLWPELIRRCRQAGLEIATEAQGESIWKIARLNPERTLALTSWRALLLDLLRAAEAENEPVTASDIRQFQGLCVAMDELAFLPLQSEELTGSTGTRITQYYQLVDDITGRLIAENIASADGLKASSVRESYRRYLRLNGFGCWVTFAPQLWGTYRSTPIWLAVQDPEFKPPARARERLAELEAEDPPRLIDMGNHLAIPLHLPLGAEKAQVVEASLEQVKEIASLLAQTAPAT